MRHTGKKQYPSFGWQGFVTLCLLVVLIFGVGGDFFFALASDPNKAKWTKAQTELGEIAKALELYAKQNGEYPKELVNLEQEYFKSGVPKDPFTKDDYIYERTPTGFRLMSLGMDKAPGGGEIPDRDIVYEENGLVGE